VLTRRASAVTILDDDQSAAWIGCAG